MAVLGAASISGVPAFGLPKINNFVSGIFKPTFAASPLWSIPAKSVTCLERRLALSVLTVCWTAWLLGFSMILLFALGPPGLLSAWGSLAARTETRSIAM